MIELECIQCGGKFQRRLCEHKINQKKERRIFCGRSCQAIYLNKLREPNFCKKRFYDISKHCDNQKTELSPFKSFLLKGRSSIKRNKVSIDPLYLKQIWETQKGICPYTGIKMLLPTSTGAANRIRSLKAASLDRVDSSKGYIKGNVEFVCRAINLAKNNYTKEEMKSFLLEMDISITKKL